MKKLEVIVIRIGGFKAFSEKDMLESDIAYHVQGVEEGEGVLTYDNNEYKIRVGDVIIFRGGEYKGSRWSMTMSDILFHPKNIPKGLVISGLTKHPEWYDKKQSSTIGQIRK